MYVVDARWGQTIDAALELSLHMLNALANVFNWNSEKDFDMFRLFERAAWSIVLPLASCQFVGGSVAVQYIIHLMTDPLDIIRP